MLDEQLETKLSSLVPKIGEWQSYGKQENIVIYTSIQLTSSMMNETSICENSYAQYTGV